jgi:hypothetical protein
VQGRTSGLMAFADELREAGHTEDEIHIGGPIPPRSFETPNASA